MIIMQPQPIEYTQPVQYTQPGQYLQPNQYAQPATQYVQPQQQQPAQFVQPGQPMMQMPVQQIVYVTQEKSSNKALPWIGVGLILVSLFMPYFSFMGEHVSGIELISEIGDSDFSSDGESLDDSDSDLPAEFVFFGIALLMIGLGPIFFIISSIIAVLVLMSGKSPKIMGIFHLSYGIIFLAFAAIGTIDFGFESFSAYDVTGIGFYLGAFASVLFLFK